jgi:transcription elongation factor
MNCFSFQGRSGIICHIFRSFVFVRSTEMTKNAGFMIVCRSHHLRIAGGQMRPLQLERTPICSPQRTPSHNQQATTFTSMLRKFREMEGKTARIVGGPFKGNIPLTQIFILQARKLLKGLAG